MICTEVSTRELLVGFSGKWPFAFLAQARDQSSEAVRLRAQGSVHTGEGGGPRKRVTLTDGPCERRTSLFWRRHACAIGLVPESGKVANLFVHCPKTSHSLCVRSSRLPCCSNFRCSSPPKERRWVPRPACFQKTIRVNGSPTARGEARRHPLSAMQGKGGCELWHARRPAGPNVPRVV